LPAAARVSPASRVAAPRRGRIEEGTMRAALVVAVMIALVAGGVGPIGLLQAQVTPDQRDLEGRIANVNGELIQLADGTVVRVPAGLASALDLREGRVVKIRYEVREKQNVATGIDFLEVGPAGTRQ
jgi:hypothetical protein